LPTEPPPASAPAAVPTVAATSAPTPWATYTTTREVPATSTVAATAAAIDRIDAGPTGHIAFVSDRDGPNSRAIYYMNADGTGLTRLLAGPGMKGGMSWKPDGSELTFAWVDKIYNIALKPGATPQMINSSWTDGALSWPLWSPDGKRLAFAFWCQQDSCTSSRPTGHYVSDPQPRLIALPGYSVFMSWSSDSQHLMFNTHSDATQELSTIDVDTGVRKKIGPWPSFSPVAWSPDGSRLVGTSDTHIFVADADGANAVQLTSSGSDAAPTWSPDGHYLAFCSNRDGNNEIYIMKADGSGQTNLTQNPANDCATDSNMPAVGPTWGP